MRGLRPMWRYATADPNPSGSRFRQASRGFWDARANVVELGLQRCGAPCPRQKLTRSVTGRSNVSSVVYSQLGLEKWHTSGRPLRRERSGPGVLCRAGPFLAGVVGGQGPGRWRAPRSRSIASGAACLRSGVPPPATPTSISSWASKAPRIFRSASWAAIRSMRDRRTVHRPPRFCSRHHRTSPMRTRAESSRGGPTAFLLNGFAEQHGRRSRFRLPHGHRVLTGDRWTVTDGCRAWSS